MIIQLSQLILDGHTYAYAYAYVYAYAYAYAYVERTFFFLLLQTTPATMNRFLPQVMLRIAFAVCR